VERLAPDALVVRGRVEPDAEDTGRQRLPLQGVTTFSFVLPSSTANWVSIYAPTGLPLEMETRPSSGMTEGEQAIGLLLLRVGQKK
jgi:hypothetical protein